MMILIVDYSPYIWSLKYIKRLVDRYLYSQSLQLLRPVDSMILFFHEKFHRHKEQVITAKQINTQHLRTYLITNICRCFLRKHKWTSNLHPWRNHIISFRKESNFSYRVKWFFNSTIRYIGQRFFSNRLPRI